MECLTVFNTSANWLSEIHYLKASFLFSHLFGGQDALYDRYSISSSLSRSSPSSSQKIFPLQCQRDGLLLDQSGLGPTQICNRLQQDNNKNSFFTAEYGWVRWWVYVPICLQVYHIYGCFSLLAQHGHLIFPQHFDSAHLILFFGQANWSNYQKSSDMKRT